MEINPMHRTVEILLIEDNPADIRLTVEALKDSKVANRVNYVFSGEDAMAYLRKQGKYADAVRPDIVLLDLNLPKKKGGEVLSEIKTDAELKRIPVVILTSSKAEEDIIKTYDLHANCYISKPVDINQFIRIVHVIEDFWFTIVKLPMKAL